MMVKFYSNMGMRFGGSWKNLVKMRCLGDRCKKTTKIYFIKQCLLVSSQYL